MSPSATDWLIDCWLSYRPSWAYKSSSAIIIAGESKQPKLVRAASSPAGPRWMQNPDIYHGTSVDNPPTKLSGLNQTSLCSGNHFVPSPSLPRPLLRITGACPSPVPPLPTHTPPPNHRSKRGHLSPIAGELAVTCPPPKYNNTKRAQQQRSGTRFCGISSNHTLCCIICIYIYAWHDTAVSSSSAGRAWGWPRNKSINPVLRCSNNRIYLTIIQAVVHHVCVCPMSSDGWLLAAAMKGRSAPTQLERQTTKKKTKRK